MAHSAFLQSFLKETPPKNIRMIAARGLAPISPDEMLFLLIHLHEDSDPEVEAQSKETLAGLSEKEILDQLRSKTCHPIILQHFGSKSASPAILEAIILNQTTPGELIEEIALRAPASLLETILYNRVRLLKFPKIVKNIKANQKITPQIQVLLEQIEQEFFGAKKREYTVADAKAEEAPSDADTALEFEFTEEDLSLEGLPLDPEEREAYLVKRIAKMTVAERIRFAHLGPREARSILIRDSDVEVSRSVLRSPKLTENEVATFSSMRDLSEEILRKIANTKEWSKSYTVTFNLVRNPKTPPMVSQRMLFRLRNKDLNLLARDRGIPEAVRHQAQRTLSQRTGRQPTR
jgi:hypothetical protein